MYLIRHDYVAQQGICYGQSDIEAARPYHQSADIIQPYLSDRLQYIYASPLSRCALLAECLFPDRQVNYDSSLMEVNFGQWEQQLWDDIPRVQIDDWARTPTHFKFPQGERLSEFYQRVKAFWLTIEDQHDEVCLVTHAGVIRALMAIVLDQPWQDYLSMSVPFLSVTELNHNEVRQRYP